MLDVIINCENSFCNLCEHKDVLAWIFLVTLCFTFIYWFNFNVYFLSLHGMNEAKVIDQYWSLKIIWIWQSAQQKLYFPSVQCSFKRKSDYTIPSIELLPLPFHYSYRRLIKVASWKMERLPTHTQQMLGWVVEWTADTFIQQPFPERDMTTLTVLCTHIYEMPPLLLNRLVLFILTSW